MRNGMFSLAALVLAIGSAAAAPASAEAFKEALITLQQNFSDGDAEVIIFVKGQDQGLTELTITDPGGLPVAKFTASQPGHMGGREFLIESPEPKDMSLVLSAFPEGTYKFHGHDTHGAVLSGTALLSHELPGPARILEPADGVALTGGGAVRWSSVPGAEKYVIKIENDALGLTFSADVSGSTTSLSIPADWLSAGAEYELSLGAVNRFGNVTVVESRFRAE